MDPTTRTNLLIFLGATAAIAAISLIAIGIQQASPLRMTLGVGVAVGAVALFGAARATRR